MAAFCRTKNCIKMMKTIIINAQLGTAAKQFVASREAAVYVLGLDDNRITGAKWLSVASHALFCC